MQKIVREGLIYVLAAAEYYLKQTPKSKGDVL
jgi:hypothetical protein